MSTKALRITDGEKALMYGEGCSGYASLAEAETALGELLAISTAHAQGSN